MSRPEKDAVGYEGFKCLKDTSEEYKGCPVLPLPTSCGQNDGTTLSPKRIPAELEGAVLSAPFHAEIEDLIKNSLFTQAAAKCRQSFDPLAVPSVKVDLYGILKSVKPALAAAGNTCDDKWPEGYMSLRPALPDASSVWNDTTDSGDLRVVFKFTAVAKACDAPEDDPDWDITVEQMCLAIPDDTDWQEDGSGRAYKYVTTSFYDCDSTQTPPSVEDPPSYMARACTKCCAEFTANYNCLVEAWIQEESSMQADCVKKTSSDWKRVTGVRVTAVVCSDECDTDSDGCGELTAPSLEGLAAGDCEGFCLTYYRASRTCPGGELTLLEATPYCGQDSPYDWRLDGEESGVSYYSKISSTLTDCVYLDECAEGEDPGWPAADPCSEDNSGSVRLDLQSAYNCDNKSWTLFSPLASCVRDAETTGWTTPAKAPGSLIRTRSVDTGILCDIREEVDLSLYEYTDGPPSDTPDCDTALQCVAHVTARPNCQSGGWSMSSEAACSQDDETDWILGPDGSYFEAYKKTGAPCRSGSDCLTPPSVDPPSVDPCAGDSFCVFEYTAIYFCADDVWDVSVTGGCSLTRESSAWTADPANPRKFTKTVKSFKMCRQGNTDGCPEPPELSPPDVTVDCDALKCCVEAGAFYSCETQGWALGSVSMTCGLPEESDGSWVVDHKTREAVFRQCSDAACDPDFTEDCGDIATGLPSHVFDCSGNLCAKEFTSRYNCASGAFSPFTEGGSFCVSPSDLDSGAVSLDPVYEGPFGTDENQMFIVTVLVVSGELCDGDTPGDCKVDPPDFPSDPPECPAGYCYKDFESVFNCDTLQWSDPVETASGCVKDSGASGWLVSDLTATIRVTGSSWSCMESDPDSCSVPSPGSPPEPDIYRLCPQDPEDSVCVVCATATYDCETETWTVKKGDAGCYPQAKASAMEKDWTSSVNSKGETILTACALGSACSSVSDCQNVDISSPPDDMIPGCAEGFCVFTWEATHNCVTGDINVGEPSVQCLKNKPESYDWTVISRNEEIVTYGKRVVSDSKVCSLVREENSDDYEVDGCEAVPSPGSPSVSACVSYCAQEFTASYSCDSESWTVTAGDISCGDPGQATEWLFSDDKKSARRTVVGSRKICYLEDPGKYCVTGSVEPPDIKPNCADGYCLFSWNSQYNCSSSQWDTDLAPYIYCGEKSADTGGWLVDGNAATITIASKDPVCRDGKEDSYCPPPNPGTPPGSGDCEGEETEDQYCVQTFTCKYNCVQKEWGSVLGGDMACSPTKESSDEWVLRSADNNGYTYVYKACSGGKTCKSGKASACGKNLGQTKWPSTPAFKPDCFFCLHSLKAVLNCANDPVWDVTGTVSCEASGKTTEWECDGPSGASGDCYKTIYRNGTGDPVCPAGCVTGCQQLTWDEMQPPSQERKCEGACYILLESPYDCATGEWGVVSVGDPVCGAEIETYGWRASESDPYLAVSVIKIEGGCSRTYTGNTPSEYNMDACTPGEIGKPDFQPDCPYKCGIRWRRVYNCLKKEWEDYDSGGVPDDGDIVCTDETAYDWTPIDGTDLAFGKLWLSSTSCSPGKTNCPSEADYKRSGKLGGSEPGMPQQAIVCSNCASEYFACMKVGYPPKVGFYMHYGKDYESNNTAVCRANVGEVDGEVLNWSPAYTCWMDGMVYQRSVLEDSCDINKIDQYGHTVNCSEAVPFRASALEQKVMDDSQFSGNVAYTYYNHEVGRCSDPNNHCQFMAIRHVFKDHPECNQFEGGGDNFQNGWSVSDGNVPCSKETNGWQLLRRDSDTYSWSWYGCGGWHEVYVNITKTDTCRAQTSRNGEYTHDWCCNSDAFNLTNPQGSAPSSYAGPDENEENGEDIWWGHTNCLK